MVGAAYVFQPTAGTWQSGTQTAKLSVHMVVTGDAPAIGISVAISGDTIAAGANGANPPNGVYGQGELFIYKRPSSGWTDTNQYTFVGYDRKAPQLLQLGVSAAIEGNALFTGAYGPGLNDATQGTLYIFETP
jgi:hypothetical protein